MSAGRAAAAVAAAALGGLVVSLAPSTAVAGPFDVFGFGTRALSMGGAMTAGADDYSATYYNPAALTRRKKVHLGVEVLSSLPNLTIAPADPDPVFEPEPVSNHLGATFGALYPIGGRLHKRVVLAAALHLPFKHLLSSKYLDPRTPQWIRYDTLPDKFQLLLSLGVEVFGWLRLGAGLQFLTSVDGGADIALDLPNEQLPRHSIEAQLDNTAAPVVGVLVAPPWVPGLHLGATYRRELALEFGLPIAFDLGDAFGFVVQVHGVSLYTPDEVAIGLDFDLAPTTGLPLEIVADATLERWSAAPRTGMDLTIDFYGDALESTGLDESLDFLVGAEPDPGFRDVWALRAGLEWAVTGVLKLRTGYGYRPSSTRPQTGVTNLVDADAHTLSVGVAATVADPLEIDENPVTFEVGAQQTLLEGQSIRPRQLGDPVGDYEASGTISTLSLSVRHDF